MRYALLNLVLCPMCKNFPLRLHVFDSRKLNIEFKVSTPFCDEYCGLKGKYIKDLKVEELNCRECVKEDIIAGVLYCTSCGRWYPIVEGIPMMYPDDLRRKGKIKEREERFLKTYWDYLPDEIKAKVQELKP